MAAIPPAWILVTLTNEGIFRLEICHGWLHGISRKKSIGTRPNGNAIFNRISHYPLSDVVAGDGAPATSVARARSLCAAGETMSLTHQKKDADRYSAWSSAG